MKKDYNEIYKYEVFNDGYDIYKDNALLISQREPYGKPIDNQLTFEENCLMQLENITNEEQIRILSDNLKTKLKNQFAIGMSYGSKVFAEVIKDKYKICTEDEVLKLDKLTESQKDDLLTDIYNFNKTTLSTDIHEMIKVMSRLPLLNQIINETISETMQNNLLIYN